MSGVKTRSHKHHVTAYMWICNIKFYRVASMPNYENKYRAQYHVNGIQLWEIRNYIFNAERGNFFWPTRISLDYTKLSQ